MTLLEEGEEVPRPWHFAIRTHPEGIIINIYSRKLRKAGSDGESGAGFYVCIPLKQWEKALEQLKQGEPFILIGEE